MCLTIGPTLNEIELRLNIYKTPRQLGGTRKRIKIHLQ